MDTKFSKLIILSIVFIMLITACSNKQDSIDEYEENEVGEIEEIEEQDESVSLEGLALNPLTGLWIDEEVANRRPVAVMINNIKKALPQSGISEADIIYETLAEGEITRLVAVFQNLDAEKIGPVRSIRDYYFNIGFDHDSIIIHHGGSPQAYEAIKKLKPSNLNTLSGLERIMAWRDPVRRKQKGMLEHSLYTSGEKIIEGWNSVKYRFDRRSDLEPVLDFVMDEKQSIGAEAKILTVPFSNNYISEFNYDEDLKIYKKSHHKIPHIDENNNEQLSFKNIIIQYTDIRVIPGDNEGRRDVRLIGSGKGIYITNGVASEITWSKNNHNTPTVFKDGLGNRLQLNPGKTYIGIFPNYRQIEFK